MDWFRMYDEIINDPKIRRMKDAAKFGIVCTLMCLANKGRPRGTITIDEGLPYELDELAERSMASPELVQEVIDYLVGDRIRILIKQDGILRFRNWDKRQFNSDTSTERSRKHRENKNATLQKRCSNVPVTPPETDKQTNRSQITDTETDINKTSAQGAAVVGNEKPNNKDLIDELTQSYRAVEGIKPAKGDHSFIGALYNKHGYEQVLDATNKLQMAAATQDLEKPLLYLKGILEPKDKGGNGSGGKPREPSANRKGNRADDGAWDGFYAPGAAPPKM